MANTARVKPLIPLVIKDLFGQVGLYGRSLGLFAALGLVGLSFFAFFHNSLNAEAPLNNVASPGFDQNTIDFTLGQNGTLYLGSSRQSPDIFPGDTTYRYRLQVIDHPKETIDQLTIAVALPKPATENTISHRFINNGGAQTADSQLTDPQTLTFTATTITPQAILAIEFEVPKTFVQESAFFALRQYLNNLPPVVWTGVSIALPALTFLVLILVALARFRSVSPSKENITELPSRLPPALLGILLRGQLTSRELAATFIDLARRGHLVIRQVDINDYRFRRQQGSDRLEDFEFVLLEQIFGPTSEAASSDEVSFAIAQELFSKRVSQAFILAYRKINELGYFYTNPLRLHRRYQFAGIGLFFLGLAGLLLTILFFSGTTMFLLFWVGMIISSLLVAWFSRNLPMRTIYGDRELERWLAFERYLVDKETINFAAQSQEKYLAYLPYAIVLEREVEWTKRFYNLPFIQPSWYVAANISTIEDFTNKVFPLFGYLSHALSLTIQPGAR